MANSYLDTSIVDKAIKFAVDAHSNTERRGKGFPYVIHVLEAMEIVATMTSDPELLAAAALHDTVEDTSVTLEDIRKEFGNRVADLVEAETDKMMDSAADECSTWRARKQLAIDRLANASYDAKMVALGDKLSNMRAILRDYNVQGDDLWKIFHAPGGKPDHEWHYRKLAESLHELAGTPAYKEFSQAIRSVFGKPKPELVDMNDYEESGDGFTAISYNHKDGKRMIKLYSSFIPMDVPERELETNWATLDLGIRNPAAIRLVTDGKKYGVEFERIAPKVSYARAISNNPDKLEMYASAFAAMAKELHSRPCNTEVFGSVSEYFKEEVNRCTIIDSTRKEAILKYINSVPETTTCCHGDLHIGNAIINTDTGVQYWIDLSDFRWGNPLFDLGMFYFSTYDTPDDIIFKLYHIDKAMMVKVWEVFVREYFGKDASLEEINKECARFAALYIIRFGNRNLISPETVEAAADRFLTES